MKRSLILQLILLVLFASIFRIIFNSDKEDKASKKQTFSKESPVVKGTENKNPETDTSREILNIQFVRNIKKPAGLLFLQLIIISPSALLHSLSFPGSFRNVISQKPHLGQLLSPVPNHGYQWATLGLIVFVAILGKIGGRAVSARITGHSWKEALSLGALMNTRGLIELVVLSIGYDLGILSAQLFTIMVLYIVLEDAIIAKAVEIGIKARFQNAGQSCIAAKRFILDRKISDEFLDLFLEGTRKLKTGNPMEEDTDIGPLAGIGQAERVEEQVVRSVAMGARVIAGGVRKKAFYQPSVVVDVTPGMPLFDEEVFGPVAPISIVDNTAEAVALAGKTNFGLGVSLFTEDMDKAYDLAREFHDGAVFINGLVKSDPRLPFGGTRHSGFGRELAIQGIREFVNIKTVWAKKL